MSASAKDGFSAQDSIVSGSAVSAPGAGATVCSVPITTPGIYEIEVSIFLTGTAETALNNGTLTMSGAGYSGAGSVLSVPTLTGVPFRFHIPRINLGRSGSVAFKATAAATAGAIYGAYISATRVG